MAGSISSKTTYLINNDISSTSGKNKKAKELSIPIISEETFATVYKGNIIKNLIMDCQSYTKYRPNETTGGILCKIGSPLLSFLLCSLCTPLQRFLQR